MKNKTYNSILNMCLETGISNVVLTENPPLRIIQFKNNYSFITWLLDIEYKNGLFYNTETYIKFSGPLSQKNISKLNYNIHTIQKWNEKYSKNPPCSLKNIINLYTEME